ncbi:hypothetical protein SDJN02_17647, partial [Cucurbita argyrosperma subsp. argyrosperma]
MRKAAQRRFEGLLRKAVRAGDECGGHQVLNLDSESWAWLPWRRGMSSLLSAESGFRILPVLPKLAKLHTILLQNSFALSLQFVGQLGPIRFARSSPLLIACFLTWVLTHFSFSSFFDFLRRFCFLGFLALSGFSLFLAFVVGVLVSELLCEVFDFGNSGLFLCGFEVLGFVVSGLFVVFSSGGFCCELDELVVCSVLDGGEDDFGA